MYLSIIIPVYGVEKYVEKCILSLLSQDCNDTEFIIVNDGTIDKSMEIINRTINNDPRFKIINKENGGLVSAWKTGVKAAKGKFIGFVDSDDWVDPDMFSTLLRKIKEYDCDVIFSGYVMESDNSSIRFTRDKEYVFCGDEIRNDFIQKYCCSYIDEICKPSINRWDKLYKKEIILNNLDYCCEDISLAEDFNANVAFFLDAKKIVLLADYTPYHYVYNPYSIANSINESAFDNIKYLSDAMKKICSEKEYESFYVDSFIGNIIFEEVNKVCSSGLLSKSNKAKLINNLAKIDSDYYLDCYVKVRNLSRHKIYKWFLNNRMINSICLLNTLNKLRNKK